MIQPTTWNEGRLADDLMAPRSGRKEGVPAPGRGPTCGMSAGSCAPVRVQDKRDGRRFEDGGRVPDPLVRRIAAPAAPHGVAPLRLSRTQTSTKSNERGQALATVDARDVHAR